MSEVPTPVSESTAIEIVRKEGSARSHKSTSTIEAGELLYYLNNSGVVETIGGINAYETVGIALYDAVSGNRVTTIRGKVRARWDGAGTVNKGTPLANSTARSGWFEPLGGETSGILAIGFSYDNLAAGNSGTLVPIELY